MKNVNYKLGLICMTIVMLLSCEPRIEMDMGQWGDKAFITNVELFKLEIDDGAKQVEWYLNEEVVTGVRRIIISNGKASIDNENFIAIVKLKSGNTLTECGFRIYHSGTLIEPQNNAPKAGIVNDLSAISFVYRVYSADGNYHDWTINITQ